MALSPWKVHLKLTALSKPLLLIVNGRLYFILFKFFYKLNLNIDYT